MNTAPIVSKVWSFCTTLRDDGVGYGDYLEQLTYLIFLKMADEYARPPYNRDVGIPEGYGWTSLTARRGADLEAHYVTLLRRLGEQKGMLGQIFTKAQNKITDPAKCNRSVGPWSRLVRRFVRCGKTKELCAFPPFTITDRPGEHGPTERLRPNCSA